MVKNTPAPRGGRKRHPAKFLSFELASLPAVPTAFVSNLPYIDAADILDKVLAWPHFFSAVFMFQKEQAQRIRAHAGEDFYGPLSVFSQLRAHISPICKVGRGCFNPPPKVESAVLAFERLKEPVFSSEKIGTNLRKLFWRRLRISVKRRLIRWCFRGMPKKVFPPRWSG